MPGLQGAAARRRDDAELRVLDVRRVRARCAHQLGRQRLPVLRGARQLAGGPHPLEADPRQGKWVIQKVYINPLVRDVPV